MNYDDRDEAQTQSSQTQNIFTLNPYILFVSG